MKHDVWGVFHDGILVRIDGTVPGDLVLRIQIEYLRNQFDESGDYFIIELGCCTKFRYSEYDNPPTEELSEIQAREIDLLYVSSEQPLVLDCSMGVLELEYESMRVLLPSGRTVTRDELIAASENYWNEWGQRAKNAT
ncbi:hypothetical protein H8K35_10425 [Undibacterium sp. LX40W]|uniref:Uncharacterized protein n=1 Tax=Undibacterium nitidum TaxID=2762298 RepID=A0A923HM52_9BURK|nr:MULTISPECIES: hypothetical protein [Undibacterium]MBC3881929.1 hypothetical protein [Undibacterium nitidum]MBC3892074.1 hypothetical protein [Undibacterium sp. LX40W]